MKAFIDEFLNYLSVERGLAKNTLLAYRRDLDKYIGHLSRKGIQNLPQVKREHVSDFMFDLKKHEMSATSICTTTRISIKCRKEKSHCTGQNRFYVTQRAVLEQDGRQTFAIDGFDEIVRGAERVPDIHYPYADRAMPQRRIFNRQRDRIWNGAS